MLPQFGVSLHLAVPSLPVVLVVHEAFFQGTVLQSPDKVAVAPVTATLATSSRAAITSPCTGRVTVRRSIGRGRVIGWAGLQPDGSVWVKVTHDSLQSRRNSALLLVHCRGPLAPCSCRRLRIQILLRIVARRLLDEAHLLIVIGLCRVRRRCALVARAVHIVVHGRALSMWTLRILVHLHVSISGALSLRLCGLLLCPLSAQSFSALLLHNTGSWRPVGTCSHRHGRDEWTGVLLLGDEGMKFGLIGCPSFERIEVQQSLRKVDESVPIGHF